MRSILPLLVLLAVIATSCGAKKNCTFICSTYDMRVLSQGYAYQDIDTVVLRQYYPGSFNELISETTRYQDTFLKETITDSSYVNFGGIKQGYNWEIYIPALAKTYRVSDIKNEGKETAVAECRLRGCVNQIVSFRLNDSLVYSSRLLLSK